MIWVLCVLIARPVGVFGSDTVSYYYRVKKNDYVIKILRQLVLRPIYGEKGSLSKVHLLNSQHISDINKIYVGQKIYFSQDLAFRARDRGYAEITVDNEILIVEPDEQRPDRSMAQAPNDDVPSDNTPDSGKAEEAKVGLDSSGDWQTESQVQVALQTGYLRIDSTMTSTGAKAILLSRPILGVGLEWEHSWSRAWSSFVSGQYQSFTFEEADRGTVYDRKPSALSFGLGLRYMARPTLWTQFEVGMRDQIFSTSYASGTANLETKSLPYLKILLLKDMAQTERLKFSAGIGGSYLFGSSYGSSYDVDPGREYFVKLLLEQKLKSHIFFYELNYVDSAQDTSVAEQTRQDILTYIGIRLPLSKEDKK